MPESLEIKHGHEPHVIVILDDTTEYGRYLRQAFYVVASNHYEIMKAAHSNRRYANRTIFHGIDMVTDNELLSEISKLRAILTQWRYETASLESLWKGYTNPSLPSIAVRLRYPDMFNVFMNLFSLMAVYRSVQSPPQTMPGGDDLNKALKSFLREVNSLPELNVEQ